MEMKDSIYVNKSSGAGFIYSAFALIYFLMTLLLQGLVSVIDVQNLLLKNSILLLASTLSMIVVCIAFAKLKKKKFTSFVMVKKFNPLWIIASICFAVGIFFGLGFVNDSIIKLLESIGVDVSKLTQSNIIINDGLSFVVYTFVLCILPAICEEMLFRGAMLNLFEGQKDITKILITAFAFSLYHASPAKLVYQFIYGIILGFIVVKSRSIIPTIVAHFLNNFVVVCFEFFNINLNLYSWYFIVFGIISIICTFIVCFVLTKKRIQSQNTKEKATATTKDGIYNFFMYGIIAEIIFIILLIGSVI